MQIFETLTDLKSKNICCVAIKLSVLSVRNLLYVVKCSVFTDHSCRVFEVAYGPGKYENLESRVRILLDDPLSCVVEALSVGPYPVK
jgi:hypothetical protein